MKPPKQRLRDLKIVVSAIVLFAVTAERPTFAQERHVHHAGHASVKNQAPSKSKTGKGAASSGVKPADAVDAGAAVAAPSLDSRRDAIHDVKPGVTITKPENSQAHHMGVPGPSHPVVRNAIGQQVTTTPNATVGLKRFAPSVETTVVFPGGSRTVAPPKSLGEPNAGLQNTAVPSGGRIPSRSAIGGAVPIRSSAALSGLGGPAKPVAGINGTTLRPKY